MINQRSGIIYSAKWFSFELISLAHNDIHFGSNN